MIDRKLWTGGYNYILNLVNAIDYAACDQLTPVIFAGDDVSEDDVAPFKKISSAQVVRSSAFNARNKRDRLIKALVSGVDYKVYRCFKNNSIDVVFGSANFYGWRFPIPVIAWIPDFQHRHLPDQFSFMQYWQRELGFRVQIAFDKLIVLSSEDARNDCERFHPSSTGRTSVVRFAVPIDQDSLALNPVKISRLYNLPDRFFYLPNQFWKHKNHRLVIEALNLLKKAGHEVVVAASGSPGDPRHPEHYEMLKSMVNSSGLSQNFRFVGMLPSTHVVALMRACTALINPSLFEGWSTTVEEAKSLGVPMLLSNLGVHYEQMGNQASYFDPDSAHELAELMAIDYSSSNDGTRQSMERLAINSAQKRVVQFAQDFMKAVESVSSLSE